MIISVITGIAGLIIGGIFVFGLFFMLTPVVTSPPVVTPGEQVNLPNQFLTSYLSIIIVLMILWICFIISSLFLRKSYQTMSTQLDTKMFHTVATIYLIGAVTTIVMIGFVLLLIAEIFQIVAFFSMPEQPPPPPPPTPTTSL